MKNHLKKINFLIILAVAVLTLTFVNGQCSSFAAQSSTTKPASAQTQVSQTAKASNATDSNAKSIPEKNADAIAKMQKEGVQNPLIKFLYAMLGVLLSALIIFVGLKLYQKIVLKNNTKFDNIDYDKTLESPKDFKEAINLFLEKTDK